MAITRVAGVAAQNDTTTNGSPINLAYVGAVQVNDLLTLSYYGPAVTATITDSQGNSWSAGEVEDLVIDGTRVVSYYAKATQANTPTVTANFGADSGHGLCMLLEAFRGFTNPTLDKTVGATATDAGANSGNTGTTTTADELIYGTFADATSTGGTLTKGATFTLGLTGTHTDPRQITEYKVVSATGTYAADGTLGNGVEWACQVLTFKEGTVATPVSIFAPMEVSNTGIQPIQYGANRQNPFYFQLY